MDGDKQRRLGLVLDDSSDPPKSIPPNLHKLPPGADMPRIPGNYQSRKASTTIVFRLQEQLVTVLGYPLISA
jgi:hypothetical protein